MTVSLKAELKLDEEVMKTGPDGQAQQVQIHEIMDIKRDFSCLSQVLEAVFHTLQTMSNLERSLAAHGTSLESQDFRQACIEGSLSGLTTIFKNVRFEHLQEAIGKTQCLLNFMKVQIIVHEEKLNKSCQTRRQQFLKDIVLRRSYSSGDVRSYALCKAKTGEEE